MRKKILGITLPPDKPEDSSTIFSMYHLVDEQVHGYDSKGNYLHWHDFQFRTKEFNDEQKKLAWHVLKVKRSLSPIELWDENKNHFYLSKNSLQAKLFQIDSKKNLEHLHLSQKDRDFHLVKGVLMEEAITSAQLEGAATTRKVAKELLQTEREPRDISEKMIINNWRLIELANDIKDIELSADMIKLFNECATDGVLENEHIAGEFRTEPVMVRAFSTNEIIHQAPSKDVVLTMINQLCHFANTDHNANGKFIHPVAKACILHFMVGYIHPFMDGNGRTARALFYWYMLKNGYKNLKYISISALLKKAPKQYVKSYIYTETDENDLTHFIDYQLTVIIKALDRFKAYIDEKINEKQKALELLENSALKKELQLQHMTILRKALQNPGRTFGVKEVQLDFNVSHTSARKYLDKLSSMGLLIKFKDGKTNGYISPNDLNERLKIGE